MVIANQSHPWVQLALSVLLGYTMLNRKFDRFQPGHVDGSHATTPGTLPTKDTLKNH